MAPIPVTLNDLEGKLLLLFKNCHVSGIQHVLTKICLHMNQKTHLACNFNCLIISEAEGLFIITVSHVHHKRGNVSEMAQDVVVVTTNH